jgi:ABC-type phosphate transport system substrate-binding protein
MTADEVGAFERKYGYKVARFRVAVDALAVYVHKDNPILCLTLQQLDQIFSSTRQGSGGKSIKTWGDIGMTGEWATKPISLYGRNSISGTYEFFNLDVTMRSDPAAGDNAHEQALFRRWYDLPALEQSLLARKVMGANRTSQRKKAPEAMMEAAERSHRRSIQSSWGFWLAFQKLAMSGQRANKHFGLSF